MKTALVMIVTFMLMEPVAALVHRFIFHGFAYKLHESDHATEKGPLRKIDYFPVISAVITMAIIGLGVEMDALDFLIPVGFGMGTYGIACYFIHDIVIHRRVSRVKVNPAWFQFHYDAHMFHHRFNGPPYGFVFPCVPKLMSQYFSNGNGNSSKNE